MMYVESCYEKAIHAPAGAHLLDEKDLVGVILFNKCLDRGDLRRLHLDLVRERLEQNGGAWRCTRGALRRSAHELATRLVGSR